MREIGIKENAVCPSLRAGAFTNVRSPTKAGIPLLDEVMLALSFRSSRLAENPA